MYQGCSYFTQTALESLDFIVFLVKYGGLQTDTENTCMFMFKVIYVKN